ncbi:hypothetical protein P3S59_26110, partial [Enterobacter hormaechei]|uniref:hypothetical protein n=1 Tax=Enterobacter hormaechei TaxID=158836 RepID=UPI0023E37EBA
MIDPHTHGWPTYHKAKEIPPPQYKQFGPTTFVSSKTPLHEELTPDINNWLHKDAPLRNQARLDRSEIFFSVLLFKLILSSFEVNYPGYPDSPSRY